MSSSRANGPAGVWLLARREWGAALDSGVTALAAAGFALLANSIFLNEFFLAARAELGPWFALLPWLYVAFLPALSMRAWAEERRTKSFETLLSLPFTPLQLVLGKYLCALGVLLCVLGSALPLVALLAWVGDPDPGLLAGGFLAAFLLGAQLLALGQAASILTRDQVSAFVLAALFAAVVVLCGHPRLVSVLDGISPAWRLGSALREHLSAWPHYERLSRGLVEPAALLYFALTSALALCWTAWAVARVRD